MIGQRKHILTMWGDLCRKHKILKIEHFCLRRRLTEISPSPSRNIIGPRKRAFAEKKPAFREKTNLNNSTFSNQSTNPRPTTTLPIASGKMDFMQQ